MVTKIQLCKGIRDQKKKKKKSRKLRLKGNPHKKGYCIKVYTVKPKKPNSANRKVAKVELNKYSKKRGKKKYLIGAIVGIGHKLQVHANVLVRGGRCRDIPGCHYKFVRGVYDFKEVETGERYRSRSKYGIKSAFKKEIYKK
jgi:ribosomal protein S12